MAPQLKLMRWKVQLDYKGKVLLMPLNNIATIMMLYKLLFLQNFKKDDGGRETNVKIKKGKQNELARKRNIR